MQTIEQSATGGSIQRKPTKDRAGLFARLSMITFATGVIGFFGLIRPLHLPSGTAELDWIYWVLLLAHVSFLILALVSWPFEKSHRIRSGVVILAIATLWLYVLLQTNRFFK